MEGSQPSHLRPSGENYMKVDVGQWWDDNEGGKQKYWEENLSQCHFVTTNLTVYPRIELVHRHIRSVPRSKHTPSLL